MLIGISLAISQPRPSAYDSAANALFARFTTPPTAQRAQLINTLILSLKTAGVWAKLDALYMMAAADAQAAQRNWVADQYNLIPTSSPTFTADQGYAGNGSSSYLNTGFTPSTANGNMTLNNAHVSIRPRTGGAAAVIDIGSRAVDGTDLISINGMNGSNFMTFAVNSTAGGVGPASASAAAHFQASRAVSGTMQASRNGGTYTTVSNTSDALPAFPIFIGALNGGGTGANFSDRQMASASFGSSLTQSESTAFYNAINAYLVAVGAA